MNIYSNFTCRCFHQSDAHAQSGLFVFRNLITIGVGALKNLGGWWLSCSNWNYPIAWVLTESGCKRTLNAWNTTTFTIIVTILVILLQPNLVSSEHLAQAYLKISSCAFDNLASHVVTKFITWSTMLEAFTQQKQSFKCDCSAVKIEVTKEEHKGTRNRQFSRMVQKRGLRKRKRKSLFIFVWHPRGGGGSPKKIGGGVCGLLPKTLTLFMYSLPY